MRLLKQNTTANVMVFMADAADHVTGKTGLTLTVSASKNGGAFQTVSPLVTERGNGWYNLSLNASVMDTLGDLALHITATGADPTDLVCRVIAADLASSSNLGMSFLDAAVSSRAPAGTALSNTVWTDAKAGFLVGTVATSSQLSSAQAAIQNDINMLNDLNVSDVQTALTGQGYTAARAVKLDNLDAAVSSRAPAGTALSNTVWTDAKAGLLDKLNVTGTLANTGNADYFKADVSGLMPAGAYIAPDNAGIAAIKARTDLIPNNPAAVGSAMNLTAAYDAAKTAASAAALTAHDSRLQQAQGDLVDAKSAAQSANAKLPADTATLLARLDVTGELAHTDNADLFMATVDKQAIALAVDSVLSGVHGAGSWAGGGAGGIILLPITAPVLSPTFSTLGGSISRLSVPQNGRATFTFAIVDGAGQAVDLSGAALRFLVHDCSGNVQIQLDDLLVNANQVTVALTELHTATAGEWHYKLWNLTDRLVLASGRLSILLAPIQAQA